MAGIVQEAPVVISDYVQAAMRRATYDLMEDGDEFFARITGCQGAWANEPTLEACRHVLRELLEDWIRIKLRYNDAHFAVYDGLDINPPPPLKEAVENGVAQGVA